MTTLLTFALPVLCSVFIGAAFGLATNIHTPSWLRPATRASDYWWTILMALVTAVIVRVAYAVMGGTDPFEALFWSIVWPLVVSIFLYIVTVAIREP